MIALDPAQQKRVDTVLEAAHPQAFDIGKALAHAYAGKDSDAMAQLRGLQSLANATTRLADVEEYVMGRMGRTDDRARGRSIWFTRLPDPPMDFGAAVLQSLRALRVQAGEGDDAYTLALTMAQRWIRYFMASYLYHQRRLADGGEHD